MTGARAVDLPSPPKMLAALFGAVLLYTLIRVLMGAGPVPFGLAVAAAVASVVSLLTLGARRDAVRTFMRSGFHLGAFAFFILYPLIAADEVGQDVPKRLQWIIGWTIVLTIVGFEFGYWGTRFRAPSADRRTLDYTVSDRQRRVLVRLIGVGIVAWLITVIDFATSAGVSLTDLLLTMRGAVEGQRESFTPRLGGQFLIVQRILGGGVFLAATCGAVLLMDPRRGPRRVAFMSWVAMLMCGAVGFLSGSRSFFFFAFSPLLVTIWVRLSQRTRSKSVRWLWVGAGLLLMMAAWGVMAAVRGSDIRKYEGGLEAFSPQNHARGAFDIYSQMAVVVQAFPDLIPYQKGRSLVPLVLGWVPRAVWPDKPYPFSLFMNFLNGETLEARTASIAVGIPGEGYGNFGVLGVFLWALLMGACCRRGDDYLGGMHEDHPLRLLLAAMAGIWAAMIVRGGVPEMFYLGLGIILLPWALAIFLFRQGRRPVETRALHMDRLARLAD
jgi:oligosaccharide repeat unit polymerase